MPGSIFHVEEIRQIIPKFTYVSQRLVLHTERGSIQKWFFIYPSSTESSSSLLFPLLFPLLLAFYPSLVNEVNLSAPNISTHWEILGSWQPAYLIPQPLIKNSYLSTWMWKLYLQFVTKKTEFYMDLDFWRRNLSWEKKEGQPQDDAETSSNSAQLQLCSTTGCLDTSQMN